MTHLTITKICLLSGGLLAGLGIGFVFWPASLFHKVPTGELMPRERVVEAGTSVNVDLAIHNRPSGSKIEWHCNRGYFDPEETEKDTDLQSVFTSPLEKGRVRLWVDVIAGEKRYADVASVFIEVSRKADDAAGQPGVTSSSPAHETHPADVATIRLSTIPPYDKKGGPVTSADIEGQVKGVQDYGQYEVILYAKTDITWFVQPLTQAPYTLLDQHGRFFTWTHTGVQYAALLVRKGYVPQDRIDGEIPPNPNIIAKTEVYGRRKGE